jgi:hypothetical protein
MKDMLVSIIVGRHFDDIGNVYLKFKTCKYKKIIHANIISSNTNNVIIYIYLFTCTKHTKILQMSETYSLKVVGHTS